MGKFGNRPHHGPVPEQEHSAKEHGWFTVAIGSKNSDGQPVEAVDTLSAQSRLNGLGALWGAMGATAVAVAQSCRIAI
ncbi:hypothetical protein [Paracoccus sp. R12_1]|uniref:hypothetical protein n=1 Tax=Paracoccus sp. R12_1 TaxID=2821097 RepID=UPI001ADB5087|nr:hypothetical protein [Paracoccus sp. R12_1]